MYRPFALLIAGYAHSDDVFGSAKGLAFNDETAVLEDHELELFGLGIGVAMDVYSDLIEDGREAFSPCFLADALVVEMFPWVDVFAQEDTGEGACQ